MDEFERGQERTRDLLDMRRELQEDLKAMVRDEVDRVGYSERHLISKVKKAADDHIARREASTAARLSWWLPAVLAVLAVVGIEAWLHRPADGAFPWTRAATTAEAPAGSGDAADPATGDPATDASGDRGERARAAATPSGLGTHAARAAPLDSMFREGAPELEPHVEAVSAAAVPAVTALATRWLADAGSLDDGDRLRLHSALLQHALNSQQGLNLTVDGYVTRGPPCAGSSCPRFVDVWRQGGPNGALPPYPTGGNPSVDELLTAERAWLHAVLIDG